MNRRRAEDSRQPTVEGRRKRLLPVVAAHAPAGMLRLRACESEAATGLELGWYSFSVAIFADSFAGVCV